MQISFFSPVYFLIVCREGNQSLLTKIFSIHIVILWTRHIWFIIEIGTYLPFHSKNQFISAEVKKKSYLNVRNFWLRLYTTSYILEIYDGPTLMKFEVLLYSGRNYLTYCQATSFTDLKMDMLHPFTVWDLRWIAWLTISPILFQPIHRGFQKCITLMYPTKRPYRPR